MTSVDPGRVDFLNLAIVVDVAVFDDVVCAFEGGAVAALQVDAAAAEMV